MVFRISNSFAQKCLKVPNFFLNKMGLQFILNRNTPANNYSKSLIYLIKKHKIGVIFDVGASIGGFSKEILDSGYTGKILAFEPLPNPFSTLFSLSKSYSNLACYNFALSNKKSIQDFYISKNGVSSSLLKMTSLHVNMSSGSSITQKIRVKTDTLNNVCSKLSCNSLLKIDTQGNELDVIIGASKILSDIKVIHAEVSFQELYSGQKTFYDLDSYLRSKRFTLFSIDPHFKNEKTGQLLQADVIYVSDKK